MLRMLVMLDGTSADEAAYLWALEMAAAAPMHEIDCMQICGASANRVAQVFPLLTLVEPSFGLAFSLSCLDDAHTGLVEPSPSGIQFDRWQHMAQELELGFQSMTCDSHRVFDAIPRLTRQYEMLCLSRNCTADDNDQMLSRLATHVLHKSPLPLVICPPEYEPLDQISAVCTGTRHEAALIEWGAEWAKQLSLPLCVYNVGTEPSVRNQHLEAIAQTLQRRGLDFNCRQFLCPPEELITQFPRSHLVLIPRGQRRWLWRSWCSKGTEHVIRQAKCPVLVLPAVHTDCRN
jgi:hypothetical protein